MGAKITLAGSHRPEPADALMVCEADGEEQITVTVTLKAPKTHTPINPKSAEGIKKTLSRSAVASERLALYGAAGDVFRRIVSRNHLSVREDLMSGCIYLTGSASQLTDFFETSVRIYQSSQRRFRARSGSLSIPEEIAPWTRAVLGLDQRPVVRRPLMPLETGGGDLGLWPSEIARLYGVSPDMDAVGQCVGIVALGGGYQPSDLDAALAAMKRPKPCIVEVPINGHFNNFQNGSTDDWELAMDLQILAALIPGATLVVYFAGNTGSDLASAIRTAAGDNENSPHVLSISWGEPEKSWDDTDRNSVEDALQDAVNVGISVVAASGDLLATGGIFDKAPHVFYPASSPLVIAVGGTQILMSADGAKIVDERVWNDGQYGTGGGISNKPGVPDYQRNIQLPVLSSRLKGRGVPDLAAAAGKNPGYRIVLNGKGASKSGTSAATPLWAALIAMANAKRGRPLGAFHAFLYSKPSLCKQILRYDNRFNGIGYDAGPGWTPCTGWGAPKGIETIKGLAAKP